MGKKGRKRVRESNSDIDKSNTSLENSMTEEKSKSAMKQTDEKERLSSRTKDSSRMSENQPKISEFTISQVTGENKKENKDTEDASSISLARRLDIIETHILKGNEKLIHKIDILTGEVFELRSEVEHLREKIAICETKNKEINEEIQMLRQQLSTNKEKINDLEQQGRKEQLRFFGISGDSKQESANDCDKKVIEVIQNSLGLKHITTDTISVAHRTGKPTSGKNRPIIVKFLSRKIRQEILYNKRKLKGSGISVQEDMTRSNVLMLERASHHQRVKSTWVKNGKLFVSLDDGKTLQIKKKDSDIDLFIASQKQSKKNNQEDKDRHQI